MMAWQQIIILLSSAGAIGLVLTHAPCTRINRLGCLIGLIGQPFWLWENMRADQFGMFLVGIWFLGWYAYGLLRPAREDDEPVYVDIPARCGRAK